jgi:hypothetical protein
MLWIAAPGRRPRFKDSAQQGLKAPDPAPIKYAGLFGDVRLAAAQGNPLVPRLHAHSEASIVDAQEPVTAAQDGVGPNGLHLLRHHADIDLTAPQIAEAIERKAIAEALQEYDVMFQPDVGSAAATAVVHVVMVHVVMVHVVMVHVVMVHVVMVANMCTGTAAPDERRARTKVEAPILDAATAAPAVAPSVPVEIPAAMHGFYRADFLVRGTDACGIAKWHSISTIGRFIGQADGRRDKNNHNSFTHFSLHGASATLSGGIGRAQGQQTHFNHQGNIVFKFVGSSIAPSRCLDHRRARRTSRPPALAAVRADCPSR